MPPKKSQADKVWGYNTVTRKRILINGPTYNKMTSSEKKKVIPLSEKPKALPKKASSKKKATTVSKPKCKSNQIYNEVTNRCVLKNGVVGKAILAGTYKKSSPVKKTVAKKSSPVKKTVSKKVPVKKTATKKGKSKSPIKERSGDYENLPFYFIYSQISHFDVDGPQSFTMKDIQDMWYENNFENNENIISIVRIEDLKKDGIEKLNKIGIYEGNAQSRKRRIYMAKDYTSNYSGSKGAFGSGNLKAYSENGKVYIKAKKSWLKKLNFLGNIKIGDNKYFANMELQDETNHKGVPFDEAIKKQKFRYTISDLELDTDIEEFSKIYKIDEGVWKKDPSMRSTVPFLSLVYIMKIVHKGETKYFFVLTTSTRYDA